MRRRGFVMALASAAIVGCGVGATPAAAAPTSPELRELRVELARAVALQVPGARVREPDEEPLVGVPGIADLVAGRAEVMLDPDFWVQVVTNLLTTQTVLLPQPVDLVKPEAALPTVRVADGPRVSPLPRREVDLSSVRYEWQGRKKSPAQFVVDSETDAIAFVHDGAIAYDRYANGWSPGVRHQPWSVTKSFVSALVGIAVDEGRVPSLEEPIDTYLTWLKGSTWRGTTIRNLLEMESGVHWDEGTPVLAVNTQVQQWVQLALDLVTGGALGQTRDEFLAALPRDFEQGTRFSYNSGNTQLLAALLEAVYDKPFNEVISEKLWVPAGMEDDARVMTDRTGDAVASQGLYSRIFDLARFGEIFRNGGVTSDGVRVVPAGWVTASTTMTEASKGDYAYQWWHGPTERSYEASGFQGQKISVSPGNCLTGVRLSHTLGLTLGGGNFAIEAGGGEWSALYRAVADRFGECRPSAAPPGARIARLRLGRTARFSRAAALRRRALRVVLGSDRAGRSISVRAVVRTGRGRFVRIASRRLTLRSTNARAVSVGLTSAGRRLLRGRRVVRATVIADSGATRVRRVVVLR